MSLITPFDPWKNKLCTCPAKYSLSPYTGCGHNCLYCYASSYIPSFFFPRPKKDFCKRLFHEIKKIPPQTFITIANSSDPYLPLENKLRIMRTALKILSTFNLRISIITKSSLIIRDLDILKNMSNVIINITITTLNNTLSKKLEPCAPSPQQRLKTIEKLSKHIPVICRYDPLIYPLNTSEAKKLIRKVKNSGARQIITSTFKAKPDNLKRMSAEFNKYAKLWHTLYTENGEKKENYLYLNETMRKDIINEIHEITIGEKLEFSSCREGLEELNTKVCDGSSFFRTTTHPL